MIVTRGLGRGAPGEIVAFGLCTGAIVPPPEPPAWGGWPYGRKHHRTFEWRRWYPQQQETRTKRKKPPTKRLLRSETTEEIEVIEAIAYGAGLSTNSAIGMVFFRAHGVVRVSGVGAHCDVGYVATQGIGDAEVLGFIAPTALGEVNARGDCRVCASGFVGLTLTGSVTIKTIHNPSDEELILMILQMDEDSA